MSVPIFAVFPFNVVEVAVPAVATPETVSVPMLAVFPFRVVEVAVENVETPPVAVIVP